MREIKALCAGNPLIREKMDLDVDVAKLKVPPGRLPEQALPAGGPAPEILPRRDRRPSRAATGALRRI